MISNINTNRKMKLAYIFLIFLSFCKKIVAQPESNNARPRLDNIIPPSPNASSLGKYGEIPVSLYTGIPNISIPLFNLNEGDIKIPITLNYHAGGVKVEDEASWVGLGWSLNAGGVITRAIAGYNDLDPFGYPFSDQISAEVINDSGNMCNFPLGTAPCLEPDTEPDMFFFNFLGYSGKFVLPKDSDRQFPIKAKILSKEKIDIICEIKPGSFPDIHKWVITTPDGVKYIFSTSENTLLRNSNTDAFFPMGTSFYQTQPPAYFVKDIDDNNRDKEVVTSWYLSEILSPSNNTVTFLYDVADYYSTKSVASVSEIRKVIVAYNQGVGFGCDRPEYLSTFISNQTVTKNVYLSRIVFSNGYLDVMHSEREDIQKDRNSPELTAPKKVEKIILHTTSNSSGYKFNYGYFNSLQDYKGKRLRLESIEEISELNAESKPPYKFYYNGINYENNHYPNDLLPYKDSKSKDYWGYYNGRDNDNIYDDHVGGFKASLIPNNIRINIPGLSTPFIYKGANRESDISFMKRGTLEKINYPTGASSFFEYESNDIKKSDYNYIFPFATTGTNLIKVHNNRPLATFTINETTEVKITRQISCNCPSSSGCTIANDTRIWGEILSSTYSIISQYSFEQYNTRGECSIYRVEYVTLSPGCYNTRVIPFAEYEMQMVIETVNTNSSIFTPCQSIASHIDNVPVGGLRVTSTFEYENNKRVNEKRYEYRQPSIPNSSSGYLMTMPSFVYYNSYFTTITQPTAYCAVMNGCLNKFLAYAILNSSPTASLGSSAQGNHIGYSFVTVKYGENSQNGYSIHNFLNMIEQPQGFPTAAISSPNIIHLGNGLPLRETFYTEGNKITRDVIYDMGTNAEDYISGVKSRVIGMFEKGNCGGQSVILNYPKIAQNYQVISEWWVTNKITEKIYDQTNPTNILETITEKFYENQDHYQLTKQIVSQSKTDNKRIVCYKYPADFISNSNAIINLMKGAKHMHNKVIQQTKMEGINSIDKVTASIINKYDFQTNTNGTQSIILREISTLETTKPLSLLSPVEFSFYDPSSSTLPNGFKSEFLNQVFDDRGNVLQYIAKDGVIRSFIFGYSNKYPVAQFVGVDHATVAAFINQSILDNPLSTDLQIRTELNKIRTGLANTKALVTTYTYKPLIGMTSQTDPNGKTTYYEYDSFGRLKFIKDHNQNIIKAMDYQYQKNIGH